MLSLLVDVPFDPVEIVVNRSVVPPLSLHTQTPLSPEFHAAVMKALEVEPAKRWQTAAEFSDALHQEDSRIRQQSQATALHSSKHSALDAQATADTTADGSIRSPRTALAVSSPSASVSASRTAPVPLPSGSAQTLPSKL